MVRGGAGVILYSALLLAIVLHNCKLDALDYDDNENAGADLRFSFIKELRIEIYYSALDKNMKKFFESQVIPVISSDLGKRIHIKLIPFAGCTMEKNETTGKLDITCSDGPEAVNAGLQHFCGYERLVSTAYKEYFVDRLQVMPRMVKPVKFVTCLLNSAIKGNLTVRDCMAEVTLRSPSIDLCMTQQDIGALQWAFKRMKQLDAKTFPAIVTMYEHHGKAQDAEAQVSLWNVACRSLGKSAPECRNATDRTSNESATVDTTTTTEVSTTTAKSKGVGGLVLHTLLPCLLIVSASACL